MTGSGCGRHEVAEFLTMGGYAFYVWGAYGLTAVVLLGNAIVAWRWLRWQRQARFHEDDGAD